MLSSTTMPMPTMMASKEMMLKVNPNRPKNTSEAESEIGMASSTPKTLFSLPRKTSTTMDTTRAVTSPSENVSRTDCEMKVVVSPVMPIL